jgi:hypothetical protein
MANLIDRAADRLLGVAESHLAAALAQSLPTDDRIIMESVRLAHELVGAVIELQKDRRDGDHA